MNTEYGIAHVGHSPLKVRCSKTGVLNCGLTRARLFLNSVPERTAAYFIKVKGALCAYK